METRGFLAAVILIVHNWVSAHIIWFYGILIFLLITIKSRKCDFDTKVTEQTEFWHHIYQTSEINRK